MPRAMIISFLVAIALYNAHWFVYHGGLDQSVVSNEVRGHYQYFVGDITKPSPRNIQRVFIQLAFAEVFAVWAWSVGKKGRPWAIIAALWFLLQGAQVIWTGSLQTKEAQDWIILAALCLSAYLWNRLEPHQYLYVAWNRWIQPQ